VQPSDAHLREAEQELTTNEEEELVSGVSGSNPPHAVGSGVREEHEDVQ
jgi:hypothetical protein